MSVVNQQTIDAGLNILPLNTTPASIASTIKNSVKGNEAEAAA